MIDILRDWGQVIVVGIVVIPAAIFTFIMIPRLERAGSKHRKKKKKR